MQHHSIHSGRVRRNKMKHRQKLVPNYTFHRFSSSHSKTCARRLHCMAYFTRNNKFYTSLVNPAVYNSLQAAFSVGSTKLVRHQNTLAVVRTSRRGPSGL